MPVTEISVTLLGGNLRRQNASMVGPLTEAALERLWFDQLFLGAGAYRTRARFPAGTNKRRGSMC